jgi:hypothetical protein
VRRRKAPGGRLQSRRTGLRDVVNAGWGVLPRG